MKESLQSVVSVAAPVAVEGTTKELSAALAVVLVVVRESVARAATTDSNQPSFLSAAGPAQAWVLAVVLELGWVQQRQE